MNKVSMIRSIFLLILLQFLSVGSVYADSELPRLLDGVSTQVIFPVHSSFLHDSVSPASSTRMLIIIRFFFMVLIFVDIYN